jgi:4-carboxymuconolactone decarboxylase
MAHLPFDPATLSASDRALYEEMVERRRSVGAPFGGPYAAVMNHPQLARRIEELGFFLKFQGHLPREVYQFAVLAVARHTNTPFEWVDHVAHARTAGVPEPVIESLRTGGVLAAARFPAPFDTAASVLAATLPWTEVLQEVQDRAIQRFGMQGYVELVVLSGFYQMISTINQGFGITPPHGAPAPFVCSGQACKT